MALRGDGLVAPRSPILTSMGFDEVILTFVVVVLGGIGSVLGTPLASLGLGLFTAFFGALVSPAYTTAAAFAVLLAVLVLRPGGFGRAMSGRARQPPPPRRRRRPAGARLLRCPRSPAARCSSTARA